MKKILSAIIAVIIILGLMPSSSSAAAPLNVPFIKQFPELPRGCEVTSLAMLLQDAGVNVGKMTLAKEVKKVPYLKNGYKGNLNDGFVGNMYTYSSPGLGVYHGPIADLAEKYLPNRILDLTGSKMSEVYKMVDLGAPVWVIHNSRFKRLPASEFQTWNTISGKINITYRMHSVVITGYDSKYVYINDPLYSSKNRRVDRVNFESGWVQMGRQAISYVPEKYKFYFDTRNHWTKPYVENARKQGLMTGYNDYFFGPENSLTRGQAAVILDRILEPEQKQAKNDLSYKDISKHFGYKSILRLSNAGYMSGYPDGTFKPNGKITRAQLAAILNKIYPAKGEVAKKNFTDVKPGFWAYDAIQNIQAQGLINGDSAGNYRPDSPLKRGEMAVILDRLSN